jgi:hypothetical protein
MAAGGMRRQICKTNPITGARACTSPPETPEQQERREGAEKRQRDCAKLARDQVRDDLRFLDKYWNDDIIEEERNRALSEQQRRISDAKKRLDGLKAIQKRLDTEAEFYGPPKHRMPAELEGDIDSNRKLVESQERVTVSLVNGMHEVNEKYDAMRKRRRDLVERGSVTTPCDKALSQ